MKVIISGLMLILVPVMIFSQGISQFRGKDRSGIYEDPVPHMKKWPQEGPALLWRYDSLGSGYSSPTILGNRLFICGEKDSTSYLKCFDLSGKLLWQTETGHEWMINFPGPRATPTVVNDLVYVCTGVGNVVCADATNGAVKWKVDMLKDLHGINNRFGYSESLLVDGDLVYCTPGGKDTNLVALDRFTGQIRMISKGNGDTTAYCSPRIISHGGKKILLTLSIHHIVAIDAVSGKLLWSQEIDGKGDIHCNTPLFEDGSVYYITGGNGTVKLVLSPDGDSVTEAWRVRAIDIHGGFVKVGDFIYSPQFRPQAYFAIDTRTGTISDTLKADKGTLIFSNGMLYCFTERGSMMLLKPDNGQMTLVSSFKIPAGEKEYFSNPVINNGTLYIRHQSSLLAYDISEK